MKRNRAGRQVRDVDGCRWDVREVRATRHGFDLLFGLPAAGVGHERGTPQLIATKELFAYWDRNQWSGESVTFDLPAGRTTMKRLRRRLGFHPLRDRKEFWRARLKDLRSLTTQEFAERYKVNVKLVMDWRRKLLGRTARPADWWQAEDALEVLRAEDLTLRQKSEKLGISTSQAHRLQTRARRLEQDKAKKKTFLTMAAR